MTLDVTLFGFHGPPPALASAEAILSQLLLFVNSFFHLFRCFFRVDRLSGSPVSGASRSIPLPPTLCQLFFSKNAIFLSMASRLLIVKPFFSLLKCDIIGVA